MILKYNRQYKTCKHYKKYKTYEDIKSIFNEKFVRSIAAIRRVEYQAYLSVISSWEREYLLLNV